MSTDTKWNNADRGPVVIFLIFSVLFKVELFRRPCSEGVMRITNLRIIWYASSMPRINLSIGYSNITGHMIRTEDISRSFDESSPRHWIVEAPHVNGSRSQSSTKSRMHSKLFNTVNSVHRAYETTKLYRELKMRGAIVDESSNLKLLPLEQLVEKVNGVWNLSTDQSGEYVLGFRIDPAERLQQVCKAIQALHKAANTRPIYGVTFHKDRPPSPREPTVEQTNEQEEEDDGSEHRQLRTDAFAAYFSDGGTSSEERRPPVYSEELGLAVEQLKQGFTITDLWNIYMSELLLFEDRISPNLIIVHSSCTELNDKLFLAALEWGTARYRKTHYIRRRRFTRYVLPPSSLFSLTYAFCHHSVCSGLRF
ncbi:hypothetical protein COOONC_12149 [Cooperia oncophora]